MSNVNVDTSAIEGILKESVVLQKDLNDKYHTANQKIEKAEMNYKIAKKRIDDKIRTINNTISKCKRQIEDEKKQNESSYNNASVGNIYGSNETLKLLEEKKKKALELSAELDNIHNIFVRDVENFNIEFSKVASNNQLSNLNRFLDKLKISIENYLQVSFGSGNGHIINFSNYTVTTAGSSDSGESSQLTLEREYHNYLD